MQKIQCEKCGNNETEILRRGKFADDILFCPNCDDICNKIGYFFLYRLQTFSLLWKIITIMF
jgi:uncharacterized Zn finger protein